MNRHQKLTAVMMATLIAHDESANGLHIVIRFPPHLCVDEGEDGGHQDRSEC